MRPAKEEGCPCILEDGRRCGEPLTGRKRFCEGCRKRRRKQTKSEAQKKGGHVKDFRRDKVPQDPEKYRNLDATFQFRSRHGLTKRKLSKGIAKAQLLRDLWPAARDDQHDFALNNLQDIQGSFINDPLPLPQVIDDALSRVSALSDQLDKRRSNDFIAARLLAYYLNLDCSIGRPICSKRSFGPLGKRIVAAQKAWSNQGDLINLSMSLCLHADFCRARFFHDPKYDKHLDDAERWLNAAQYVLGLCPNQDESAVLHMRHNCVRGKFRIKFDQGAKSEELRVEIDLLRKLASDIDEAKISFLTACYETEWSIYDGETEQAEQHLKDAAELFPQIGINPFNLREYTLRLQTFLAHEQEKFDERDAYFKEYITLLEQEPTIHGYRGLKEFRQLYGDHPEPCTFTPRRLYVNLMFAGLQEALIRF